MQLINTNFIEKQQEVPLDTCRVYQTYCDDNHFSKIINVNRQALKKQFVRNNHLYVIMENENIQDAQNFYGSISYTIQRMESLTMLTPCIITIDNISNKSDMLAKLLFQSLEHLSFYYDNPRLCLYEDDITCLNLEEQIHNGVRKILYINEKTYNHN